MKWSSKKWNEHISANTNENKIEQTVSKVERNRFHIQSQGNVLVPKFSNLIMDTVTMKYTPLSLTCNNVTLFCYLHTFSSSLIKVWNFYLNWNSFHPTERQNTVLVSACLAGELIISLYIYFCQDIAAISTFNCVCSFKILSMNMIGWNTVCLAYESEKISSLMFHTIFFYYYYIWTYFLVNLNCSLSHIFFFSFSVFSPNYDTAPKNRIWFLSHLITVFFTIIFNILIIHFF